LVHDARRWNPQRAPSCAHPDESLTERESQVLEQALTDLSGVRFPEPTVDTVLRHAQPATEASPSPISAMEVDQSADTEDDLCPLPEGWIGGNNLRCLPRRVIRQIELKATTRIGRGRRIAVGTGAYKFIVTIKDDGRLYIAPREERWGGGCVCVCVSWFFIFEFVSLSEM